MTPEKYAPVDRPPPGGWRRRLSLALATGFGLGYSPVASGTVGTLWGILLVAALNAWGHAAGIALAAVLLAALAIPVCHDAEAVLGRKDDGRIVADEYLTFPLCMLGLPFWPMIGIAFVTCRFFDIVKPPPARRLQDLPGGTGIVLDDVVASLYSLALNHAIYWGIRAVLEGRGPPA